MNDVARTVFEELDRHVLATMTVVGEPDCSCGWGGEPYTYEAWKEHVGAAILVAVGSETGRLAAQLDAIEAMLTKKKRMGTLFDVQQIRGKSVSEAR